MIKEYYEADADGKWKVIEQENGVIIRHLEEPGDEYIANLSELEGELEPRDYLAEIDDLRARVGAIEASIMPA